MYLAKAILVAALLPIVASLASAKATLFPVPAELRSDRFTATLDGHPAQFAHAAAKYEVLSFGLKGATKVAITAPTDDYWARGVEVQPWRHGIRPEAHGRVITFKIQRPMQITITRPGDHLGGAEMLFLFANPPEANPPQPGAPGIRYYKPGVYHEYIDMASGDQVYLAPGAVVFGGINIWGVENVKVSGRGIVVYDGPQNPNDDEGWMHKRNWHAIVMDNAKNVAIEGISCFVRSRTWMIQMKDSHQISFDNVKVIGGSPGNANQDGMDWLGGGDTVVRDTFIRAADDNFALQGNWPGYSAADYATPGNDVRNITIERSVLSTSISNTVRVSWAHKIFNSGNFTMRDSDIIHMGIGGCVIPFAMIELWSDPEGHGQHSGYHFENIRLEDWYSLVRLQQQQPGIRDVTFKNIWALETPSMDPSIVSGDVEGVSFDYVKIGGSFATGRAELPVDVPSPTKAPEWKPVASGVTAEFSVAPNVIRPKGKVTLDASATKSSARKIVSYDWLFGDGTHATGRVAHHKFPDAAGTLRDGSGRFRVLLKVTDDQGNINWASRPLFVAESLQPAEPVRQTAPGLAYRYYEGAWPELPAFDSLTPAANGTADSLQASAVSATRDTNFGVVYSGYIDIPADGGYTFMLLSRDGGKLEIGSQVVAQSPAPFAQVCGSVGNSVQSAIGSIALLAGKHAIRLSYTKTTGDDAFALKWQGPAGSLADVPPAVLTH